jgi:Rho-binding antiterminator
MMTDYTPVDCGIHSEYELAIMHHEKLDLGWSDAAGAIHLATVLPVDLCTRNSEEFLVVATTEGAQLEIRLDRITHCRRD